MKKNGFTFIEILGVITLLSLLAVVVIVVTDKNLKDSKNTLTDIQISNIRSAASMWRTDNIELIPDDGYYVISLGELMDLGYIGNVVDPNSNKEFDKSILINVGINDVSLNNTLISNGYKALKYIESTGSQYINTGYIPDSLTDMEIEFSYLGNNASSSVSWAPICGERSGAHETYFNFWVHKDNSKIAVNYGNYDSLGAGSESISQNVKYVLKNKGGNFYLNDDMFTSSTTQITKGTTPIYIFAIGNGNSVDNRQLFIKLYSFKISENGKFVRYMIPVKKKSDNVVGLYDVINDKFYTNNGTGTFNYGEF